MEPILVKYATHHGFQVRFSTELISAERDSKGDWVCKVSDHVRGDSYTSMLTPPRAAAVSSPSLAHHKRDDDREPTP